MSALPVSELLVESILQSVNDGIVVADSDLRILAWNKSAERIFGYAEREILGYPMELLVPERYRDSHRLEIDRFKLTGRSNLVGVKLETAGLRRDGTDFPIELSIASWTTSEATFFTAILRDLTESRHSEELRRFVAHMSHELRTPLTAIIGFVQILLRNRHGHLDSQELDFLKRIMLNASDQLQLINSVLDLSKIEAGKMDVALSSVSVQSVIDEVVRQIEGQRTPKQLMPVRADAAKLKRVLLNLVDNALKFTDSGSVTIRVQSAPWEPRPVRIDVIDTGIGIPPDQIPEMFRPFHQLNGGETQGGGGTGLGLSICRSLCELMGFQILVSSEPGRGSTFSVVLDSSAGELRLTA
jgi:PAS domain S-box-containing protein